MRGKRATTTRGSWISQYLSPCGGLTNKANQNYENVKENNMENIQNNNQNLFSLSLDDIANLNIFDDEKSTNKENFNEEIVIETETFEDELDLETYNPEIPYFLFQFLPEEIIKSKNNYEKQVEFLFDRILYEPFAFGFLRSRVKVIDKRTKEISKNSVKRFYQINPFEKRNRYNKKFLRTLVNLYFKKTKFYDTVMNLKNDGIIDDNYPFEVAKMRMRKFVLNSVKSTSDIICGVGYVNPLFYFNDTSNTTVGLGAVIKKNTSLLELFIFLLDSNHFVTSFLFSNPVSGEYYGYPKYFPVYPRSVNTAYIHSKTKQGFIILDIDVTDKNKKGEKVLNPDKKAKAVKFIKILQQNFDNVFVRYSRSGMNYHVLIVLDYTNYMGNKTLITKKIYKLLEALHIVTKVLPYDSNALDFARLFFGSPYPFIPIKFQKLDDVATVPVKFLKSIQKFVKEMKEEVEEDIEILEQNLKDAYNYIMKSKSVEELNKNLSEIKYDYKVKKEEIKLMQKLNSKNIVLENPTADEIIKKIQSFKYIKPFIN